MLQDNTQTFSIGIVLYSTTCANKKKCYIHKNIYLFIYGLFKDNDWNTEYTLQHVMITELVNNECKGIKGTRSWHYFSQWFDIGLSVLRRNMLHFTQGNRSIIAAILFLSSNKQHDIQTNGEVRHGSTSSRHSTNEDEVSSSSSKALEIMREAIRLSGQKNVTKGKEFHTRTKNWGSILYHTRYMLYLNIKKRIIYRHAMHESIVLRRFRITMVARGNTMSIIYW